FLPDFYLSTLRGTRALHSFPTRRSSDLSLLPYSRPQPRPYASFLRGALGPRSRLRRSQTPMSLTKEAKQEIIQKHGRDEADTGSDRKSTRLNSSHLGISYAVFCLKKKKT